MYAEVIWAWDNKVDVIMSRACSRSDSTAMLAKFLEIVHFVQVQFYMRNLHAIQDCNEDV